MLLDEVEAYLAIKRSTGFELDVPGQLLKHFARFAQAKGQTHVKAQTAIEWASQARSMNQRFHRLNVVVRFANYIQAEDPLHEVPPRHVFGRRRTRPAPFIFTKEQSNQLLLAATRLRPANSVRPYTYATLFALLLITGMRISEALALTLEDFKTDGLVIRKTKFKKSRMIPLHETAKRGLEQYLKRRNQFNPLDNHLFISTKRTGFGRAAATWAFRNILKEIGLNPAPDGRRPRIHDLRHTFACRALQLGPADQRHAHRHIRALSIYMGHVHVSDTFWYLEATPELMQDISDACEPVWNGGAS